MWTTTWSLSSLLPLTHCWGNSHLSRMSALQCQKVTSDVHLSNQMTLKGLILTSLASVWTVKMKSFLRVICCSHRTSLSTELPLRSWIRLESVLALLSDQRLSCSELIYNRTSGFHSHRSKSLYTIFVNRLTTMQKPTRFLQLGMLVPNPSWTSMLVCG